MFSTYQLLNQKDGIVRVHALLIDFKMAIQILDSYMNQIITFQVCCNLVQWDFSMYDSYTVCEPNCNTTIVLVHSC